MTTALLRTLLAVSLLAPLATGAPVRAQQPAPDAPVTADGWNTPLALQLVQQARLIRSSTSVDSAFRAYSAQARGHVYFFIDRPGSEERTLVKADQIAIEVYWRAPNQTKQRIIGLRDQKLLPTNVRYHLDHLTVVQDEFGDRIRLGDGDEVSAVLHPMAPGSERVYDFRLSDSLTISFAGGQEPVRVYELQVRPRDTAQPGFIGSVFVDRANAAIVRMNFTFTPASYVDPYLDYIRISLDNSLWDGKYWLPYRQEAELRRELPQLDFLAGSVIRGRFDIGPYEINPELPGTLFVGRTVTALPPEQLESYAFEEPLLAQVEAEGLAPPPSLEEIREQARQMVAEQYLSGLRRLRLHVPSASDVFRYNRAEGAFVGVGFSWRPSDRWIVQTNGGWAIQRGAGALSARVLSADRGTGVRAYVNQLRDVGPLPGAPGVLNTLAGLTALEDYLDPWFASGVELFLTRPIVGGLDLRVGLRAERHIAAENQFAVLDRGTGVPTSPAAGDLLRHLIRPIEEGDLVALDARLSGLREPGGLAWSGTLSAARLEGRSFGTARASAEWAPSAPAGRLAALLRADVGWAGAAAPPQSLFLLGGRETLPGHDYRAFVGDRFWLVRGEVGRSVRAPWLTLRALASAGATELARHPLPAGWRADPRGPVLFSAGAGAGLLWDVLRLDLSRGLDRGGWELAFSVNRRFVGWL